MAESSDGFLGAFKHCTLCDPVVYGGHGHWTYTLIDNVSIVCVTNHAISIGTGGRFGDSHTCDQKLEQVLEHAYKKTCCTVMCTEPFPHVF